MANSDRTPARAMRAVTATLAAGMMLSPCVLRAAPAQQELAGTSRGQQASLRPAIAERPDLLPVVMPSIRFARGSAQLTPSATRLLDRMGRALADGRLRVEGHPDAASTSRDLADRRAQAVARYLEQNCGLSADRVEVTMSLRTRQDQVRLVDLGP